MPTIQLPNNWRPRGYQMDAWRYLERGGKHAELIWARRHGKDETALHRTACAAFERVANYWHMLPQASQARKAIWDAVNPHTGRRRIDEAFPPGLRAHTRNNEMQIVFKNGSSWQVLGSDNYNSAVGSAPAGIVYSEWALANPAARAYLRPILAENGGWQLFITTPRGKNHAYRTFQAAKKDSTAFAQIITAADSGIFSPEQLMAERQRYIADFGPDFGVAMFEQEYMCSFDAAILGAFYGLQMGELERRGRMGTVVYDDTFPVHTAWDLGYSDDTSIWFYQVVLGEIRLLECYSVNGKDVDHYAEEVKTKPYHYGTHWLPHDAQAKTLASGGKSVQEQLAKHFGWNAIRIVPQLSVQDGIQAVRKMLPNCWFDAIKCEDGIEALSQYQREYDHDKKMFRDAPRHDWCSHLSDAFRMLAIAWKQEPLPKAAQPTRYATDLTVNEMIRRQTQKRLRED